MTSERDPSFRSWDYATKGDYHRNLDLDWSYAPTYLAKMKHVRSFLDGLPAGAHILDAGCGEGVLVRDYRARGVSIEGLDANYESAEVRRGDVRAMPFGDSAFDVVLLLDVFEHLAFADQPGALREIGRVLKADGTLVVSVPNLAHWESRVRFALQGRLERSDVDVNHVGERPLRENLALLEAAGFRVVRAQGVTLTVPGVYSKLICRWPRQLRALHDALEPFAKPELSLLTLLWCKKAR